MRPGPRFALDRRRMLLGTFGASVLAGSGRAGAARPEPLEVAEVAPGIFVHAGVHELAAEDNLGAIANVGFIIGADAVAVIDSGGCARAGRRLRQAIRARTDLPIRHVIATHVHPDHIFGHAAFLPDAPAFVGHARLPAAMAARGRYYLDRLNGELGDLARGTELVPPDVLVEEPLEIDLGDRVLELDVHRTAHTDNDLTVFDRTSGTLWLADLLFMERCPSLDGSLLGWLGVLDHLAGRDAARVVPGHGPISAPWPQAAMPQRRYLELLRDRIQALQDEGGTIEEAVETIGWGERGAWRLFDVYHPRNVTAAFAELEWE
jgi:quinoprotein relay system zinc metallohydrolase 2